MKKVPKIITFDLETLANMDQIMNVLPGLSAYPGLTLKASINSVICFGYKVLGEKKAQCVSAWDFPSAWKKDVNNDYHVVKKAKEILESADGIITHNGIRFDLKFLNSRLVYHGLTPVPKVPHIDTCSVAKSRLFLFNNRLNTVAKHLGCELKMENGGWGLWEKVLKRDPKSCATMTKYCKQDVEVTEEVFLKLRPMITNVPNYNLFSGNDINAIACPNCGSTHHHKNGRRTLSKGPVQRYSCNTCGTNFYKATNKSVAKAI